MDKKLLRSQQWFGKEGKDGFIYRAWMKNQGIPDDAFKGKPVIGICNTWSELTPCNAHFRDLAQSVRKGVLEAGGFPLEFPSMSLGETLIKPTAMLFRNLLSMEIEESIRANPLDGVILLCGCDKTTPALLMGACSVDIPTLIVSGGPMLPGRYKGKRIGTSDLWRFSEERRAGVISEEELNKIENQMCSTPGHCAVMGTASSMACMVESLGMSLPENAAIPAVNSHRKVLAQLSGRRIVDMVREDLKPSDILTRKAFENAIKVNTAIGGSTNFVLHLLAIAGRVGVPLDLEDFDKYSSDIPLLANLQPSGEFFMEDLYNTGGLPAVLKEMQEFLNTDAITVTGKSVKENLEKTDYAEDRTVVSTVDEPFKSNSGTAILKGSLCPDGGVIKLSAVDSKFMQHTGAAVVFENIEDYKNRIDDPDLPVDENSILVLKNVGLKGYPGMPEVGNMGLPKKLLAKGITDLVRISDGRMSGTGFGTVVLHVSPETAEGGPIAYVKNGDLIELNIPERTLNLLVDKEEMDRRRAQQEVTPVAAPRGYLKLFVEHVEQAHLGADFDFLKGSSGSEVLRDSH